MFNFIKHYFFGEDAEVRTLKKHISYLEDEIRILRAANSGPDEPSMQDIPLAGFDDLECEPRDTKEREGYVMEVSNFFDDILQPKLRVAIADIREELAHLSSMNAGQLGLTREQYDFYIRGMEGGLWKIHEWCVTLQGERRSGLQEEENNQ